MQSFRLSAKLHTYNIICVILVNENKYLNLIGELNVLHLRYLSVTHNKI